MEKKTKVDIERKIQKYINKFKIEDILVYIAVLTMFLSFVTFALRGFWYAYMLGYYQSLKIDICYLEIDETMSLYSVLGIAMIGLTLFFVNYLSYRFVLLKKVWGLIVEILFVTVIIFVYAMIMTNTEIIDIVRDILQNNQGKGYIGVIIKCFLTCVLLIGYGIVYGGIKLIEKRTKLDRVSLFPQNERNIKTIFIYFAIIFVITVIYLFIIGVCEGNEKTNFKLLCLQPDSIEELFLNDKYFFNGKGEKDIYNIYAVLYENQDIYLVAYIYNAGDRLCIDKDRQRVIKKDNITTVYKDIGELSEENDKTTEIFNGIVNNEENSDQGVNIMELIIGMLIGTLDGCIIMYFITKSGRKKEKKKLQSHDASILYYDLKSIEQYFRDEEKIINIRYSQDWQKMIANCCFLDDICIEYLYCIYGEVYNYKTIFNQKTKSRGKFEEIEQSQKAKIKRLLWNISNNDNVDYNSTYENVLKELQKVKDM